MKRNFLYLIVFFSILIVNKSLSQSPENVVQTMESDTSLSENVSFNICLLSGIALSAFEDQDRIQIAIPIGLLTMITC